MTNKNLPTEVSLALNNLSPDFSEVTFSVVDDSIKSRTSDYTNLDAVKALLAGKVIEIPRNTKLDRLYRFMRSQGYIVRRRTLQDKLVIWLDERPKTE